MKVLYITGLHPRHDNPIAGIFITRRLKKLKEIGINYSAVSYNLNLKENFLIKIARFLLKKPAASNAETITVDGITYNFAAVKVGLLDKIFFREKFINSAFKALQNELNLNGYDLIHAHWAYPHGYIASLLKSKMGIPYVLSVHGNDIHTDPWEKPRTKTYVREALTTADKVIFVSSSLYEKSKELGYTGYNHEIIPNGVDTSLFKPILKDDAKKELQLCKEDKKYVGFIGSLDWVKRADRLPELFYGIAQNYKDVTFVIVGQGNLRDHIEKKIIDYNLNVTFTGLIDPGKVMLWLNILDVLILPSRREGFGNIIIEAQACGCPVVGSNVGGIPEALGDGGIVVDVGESFEEDFVNAVVNLLENPIPAAMLRKRAMQYDWDVTVKKEIDVYYEILARNQTY